MVRMYVNFSKFFRGRAGHGGKENFRHVAERGGENSLCGGDPQRPKYVAEISHGGKNRCGGNSPWRKNIAMAEKKISVAENFFCIRPSSVSTLFILFKKRNDKDDALEVDKLLTRSFHVKNKH